MENAYTFGAEGAMLRQQENVRVIIKGPRVEMRSLTGEAGQGAERSVCSALYLGGSMKL